MENCKNNLSSSIIALVEKFVPLYIEYLIHRTRDKKLWLIGSSLANWIFVLLLTAIIFATISWTSLMGLLFVYLQLLQLSVVNILFIVLMINVSLLFIIMVGLFRVKKKALDMNL